MADDPTDGGSEPPDLTAIPGGKKGPAKHPIGHAVTFELYEAMWDAYAEGDRSISSIRRKTGVGHLTAKKAITRGWPQHGWAPLKDRAKLHDKMVDEQKRQPKSPERVLEAQSWLSIRKQHLTMSIAIRHVLGQAIIKLRDNMEAAVATTIRSVRKTVFEEVLDVKTGKVIRRIPKTVWEDVTLAPSIFSITSALADCSNSLARTGGHEIDVAYRKPPAGEEGGKGWSELTNEQMDYIIKNEGRLPPGVVPEKLGSW